MSRFPDLIVAGGLAAALIAAPVVAGEYGLGRSATEAEITAWDIDVRPDGAGLPDGSGSVFDGEEIFTEQCAVCHGDFGEAVGRWPQLAGGFGTIDGDDPVKTVGSYWPYLSTVFDYVHRAMPFGNAQSLSADDTYALTAYILYLNDIVDDEFELSKETFAEVEMPNADGFFMDDREEIELTAHSADVCMENCKEDVEITKRARILDVTPETADDNEPAGDGAAAEEPAGETETDVATAAQPEEAVEADAAPDPALVAAGENVFKQCKACHQVGDGAKNRVGPHLSGVFGRAAGAVDGFRYSKPMAEAGEGGLVWTHDTMAEFLADPKGAMKGTKMTFRGLKDPADIDAVIAYLQATGG